MNADSSNALNDQAYAHRDAGRFAEAAELWEKLIREFPNSECGGIFHHNAAQCYERLGDLDKAIPLYETAIALRDGLDVNFVNNFSLCLEKKGDFARAFSVLLPLCKQQESFFAESDFTKDVRRRVDALAQKAGITEQSHQPE